MWRWCERLREGVDILLKRCGAGRRDFGALRSSRPGRSPSTSCATSSARPPPSGPAPDTAICHSPAWPVPLSWHWPSPSSSWWPPVRGAQVPESSPVRASPGSGCCAPALAGIFVAQELLEAALAPGRPGVLAGAFDAGAWVSVPLAVLLGAIVASRSSERGPWRWPPRAAVGVPAPRAVARGSAPPSRALTARATLRSPATSRAARRRRRRRRNWFRVRTGGRSKRLEAIR